MFGLKSSILLNMFTVSIAFPFNSFVALLHIGSNDSVSSENVHDRGFSLSSGQDVIKYIHISAINVCGLM